MKEPTPATDPISILTLSETRRFIRQSHARMMVVFFAILYALGSMVLGGMLIVTRVPGGYTSEVLWGNALGSGAWNYPGYLLVAPWGVLSLPFLATWAMILVSVGVGIGVSVALLIAARLLRDRKLAAAQPGSVSAVAGLTPAMIALVTLGACCSTTAAATAGVGLVAQSSGSTLNNLLINNWYLDLFQITVIGISLFAQEMILEIYGGLFGLARADGAVTAGAVAPPPLTARSIGAGAFRAVLLMSGVTWSLAMFAQWTTVSPGTAGAALWFQWIFEHQLLAFLAVAVALFPTAVTRVLCRVPASPWTLTCRAALLVAGLSLAVWVPPLIATGGAPGFLNEVFATLGLPAAWGSVAPVFSPGLSLYLRWGFQYLLLGGFAVLVAVAPARVLRPLRWTTAAGDAPAEAGSPASPGRPSSAGFSLAPAPAGRVEPRGSAVGARDP